MPVDPTLTVLRHPAVPGPNSDKGTPAKGDVAAATLSDAMAKQWPSDAHVTAYEPVLVQLRDHGRPWPVRLRYDLIGEFGPARMRILIGDVDDAFAHKNKVPARLSWRAEVEPLVEDSGLTWYRTNGGLRVFARLTKPFTIDSREAAAEWKDRYHAWADELQNDYGIILDRSCSDWTRCYRLPNVLRDGKTVSSDVFAEDAVVRLPRATQKSRVARVLKTSDTVSSVTTTTERQRERLLEALGDARDHDGSKFAICGAIGGLLRRSVGWSKGDCAAVIREWLPDDDDVDVAKGVNWAVAAWAKAAEHVSAVGALERLIGEDAASDVAEAASAVWDERRKRKRKKSSAADEKRDPWDPVDLSSDDAPIEYLCEGLRLAPSRGKVSILAGQPGAGKGPAAAHLAVCVALGKPVFGVHATRQTNVIMLDVEGARLTKRRVRRMCAALDVDPAELRDKLWLFDSLGVNFVADETIDKLSALIEERGAGLVVLDSYTSAMVRSGVDQNSQQYAILAQALSELDVAVVIVAHARKAAADRAPKLADVAYSTALSAMGQTAILLRQPEDSEDDRLCAVSCARAPETRFEEHVIRWDDLPNGGLRPSIVEVPAPEPKEPGPEVTPEKAPKDAQRVASAVRAARRLASVLRRGDHARKDAESICGGRRAAFEAALGALVEAGLVESSGGMLSACEGLTRDAAERVVRGGAGALVRADA